MEDQELFIQAKNIVLNKISRRECSCLEVQNHLIRKGIPSQIAERVVEQFSQSGTIDDDRFFRVLVRHYAVRGKGPAYIRQKLRLHGINKSSEQISELSIESTQISELATAKEFVLRKYPEAWEDRKQKNRAIQALVRRGFSFQLAIQVFSKSS